ncbi:uncharacterized protein [Prorops nasuta]|uniref:uncharacterized protein n=1 Tax=Prorops nasuta TaxID=863751 RepID=UPI0034CFD1B6
MDGYVVTAWKSFYKLPPLKQTMEECGLLALQLFYANESLQFYNLRKKFDLLIEETTYRLMESWPKIPSFPSIRGYMNIFKKNVIGDNHWYDINIMRVSEEMFDISLRKIGYMFHRADFNPLEIAIMYEGAAKRLGVCCTKNISKLILNEKKKRIKSRHFRYWYRLFLSAIKDLPKRKASLIKDIQRVMGTESFDTRHQFFLEQINLIEIPDNVDDFLQIAKLYVILKTVYWSVRSLHPEWQYLLRIFPDSLIRLCKSKRNSATKSTQQNDTILETEPDLTYSTFVAETQVNLQQIYSRNAIDSAAEPAADLQQKHSRICVLDLNVLRRVTHAQNDKLNGMC